MKKTTILWVFLGSVFAIVIALILFIQSQSFARVLKQVVRKYVPIDLHMEGDFSELAVKLIPPGVVIKSPSVTLKEKNPVGLPAGTKLDAKFIDVTFQFFQLLNGHVTINAFAIHGASVKLDLNEDFFGSNNAEVKKEPIKKKVGISFEGLPLSWDSIVKFHFRSVSLVDSMLDFHILRSKEAMPIVVSAYVKELTLGRGTIDGNPTYDVAADMQKAYIEYAGFKRSFAQFQASMELSSKGVNLKNLGWQDGELSFHADGRIKGNVLNPTSLKSDLNYVIRGPLSDWLDPSLLGGLIKLPKNFPILGAISVEGRMQGDLLNMKKTAETNATVTLENSKIGEWNLDKLLVKGAWKAPIVQVELAEAYMGGGKVRLNRFDLDLDKTVQNLAVKAELDHADFRQLLGPAIKAVYPLHTLISGEVNARLVLGDNFSVVAETDLTLNQFSFDNQKPNIKKPLKVLIALDEFSLKSKVSVDKNGVRVERAELKLPETTDLVAQGKVDSKNGYDLSVAGKIDMSEFKKLSAFDITGVGNLLWTIKGKNPGVLFTFDIDVDDAYYLNLKLGKAKGRLVYNDGNDHLSFENLQTTQGRSEFLANGMIDLGESDKVNLDVNVSNGTIQDFAEVFSTFLKRSVPWYPYDLLGQMSGLIKARGKTDTSQLDVEGDITLENISYWHETIRSAKVHGGYRRGDYIAENIRLKKKSGFINGNIVFSDAGILKFNFDSENLTSLDFDVPASLGIPYRAPISFSTEGVGKLGNLKGFFNFNLGEGLVKLYRVPPVSFKLNAENGRLKGAMDVFSGQLKGALDFGFEKGSSSSLDIVANNFQFQPILVGINPGLAEDPELDANLVGESHLKFQTGSLSHLSGKVSLGSYLLKRKGYLLSLKHPIGFQLQNGNYEFEGAGFTGSNTNLSINGKVQNGRINYDINGPLDLGLFEFIVPEIATFRGKANVNAKLTGNADSPDLTGTVTVDTSDLRLRSIEQPFEDLKYKVDIAAPVLKVSNISAKYAGGSVQGFGQAVMYFSKLPTLDFKFDLDDPKIKVFPVAYARTKGKLSIKGNDLPYTVKGAVNISEALVTENFSLSEGSKILRTSKFIPQKKGGGSGDLQIFDLNVDILADKNIFVRNDLFDLELKGNLKVINGIKTPRLLGNINVLHGKLLFKDNYFTLQSGEVHFNNPSALDPEFNLTGQTEVKGYKINLNAGGKVSDYKLSFQSNPPLSQSDIVNLLTLGVTSSGFQNISRSDRDAYSRDEMYNLLFSQSKINKGLQDKLGVKVRVDQSQVITPENAFRAKSASELAGSGVAPKVVLQKDITKNLKASIGSTVGVGDNQERNANLELGLTKNWSVKGVYEDQRGAQLRQQRTSIGADVHFKKRF